MWILGAVVATGALVAALLALYSALFNGWAEKVSKNFFDHLWIYQAMRAWELDGNLRPSGHATINEAAKLKQCARELIDMAEDAGYVLTISTEAESPLAMGNSYMDFEVRPSRERYQHEAKAS